MPLKRTSARFSLRSHRRYLFLRFSTSTGSRLSAAFSRARRLAAPRSRPAFSRRIISAVTFARWDWRAAAASSLGVAFSSSGSAAVARRATASAALNSREKSPSDTALTARAMRRARSRSISFRFDWLEFNLIFRIFLEIWRSDERQRSSGSCTPIKQISGRQLGSPAATFQLSRAFRSTRSSARKRPEGCSAHDADCGSLVPTIAMVPPCVGACGVVSAILAAKSWVTAARFNRRRKSLAAVFAHEIDCGLLLRHRDCVEKIKFRVFFARKSPRRKQRGCRGRGSEDLTPPARCAGTVRPLGFIDSSSAPADLELHSIPRP